MIYLCIIATMFSLGSLWFISPLNKKVSEDMKQLFILCTLCSPVVLTLLTIASWVLFLGVDNGE